MPVRGTVIAKEQAPLKAVVHSESDEGDANDHTPPLVRGGRWPRASYSHNYRWDKTVPQTWQPRTSQQLTNTSAPGAPEPTLFRRALSTQTIRRTNRTDCTRRLIEYGTWVLDYGGDVRLKSDNDAASEYACEFGDKGELTLDSTSWGTEARFINDYRNTGNAQVLVHAIARTAWSIVFILACGSSNQTIA